MIANLLVFMMKDFFLKIELDFVPHHPLYEAVALSLSAFLYETQPSFQASSTFRFRSITRS
jgi:hypothetical protein